MAEGFIINNANLKKQLADLNRDYYGRQTWHDAILASNFSADQQLQNLDIGYNDAIAKAYQSAQANKQQIENSNLGIGYKSALLEENDAALEEAYNTYYNNYVQSKQNVIDYNTKSLQAIDEKLTTQADFTGRYIDSRFGYLQDLINTTPGLFESENAFKRWTNETTDENGEKIRTLKTKEELLMPTKDENGEYTSLIDEQGNFTALGVDFFDQLDNMIANGYTIKDEQGNEITPKSFSEYLSESDKELFDWAMSQDIYNYTEEGTNKGTFRTLLGLKSTDGQYSFIERFGGMTSKEIDTMYDDFRKSMNEINDKVNKSAGRDSKDLIGQYQVLTNNVKTFTDKLGITEDFENELQSKLGISSIDELGKYLANLQSNAKSNSEIWWSGIGNVAGSAATGAIIGSNLGPEGAVVGGLSGLVTGTMSAIINSENDKSNNRALVQKSKELYTRLLTSLVAYSKQTKDETQQKYKRNY